MQFTKRIIEYQQKRLIGTEIISFDIASSGFVFVFNCFEQECPSKLLLSMLQEYKHKLKTISMHD